MGLVIIRACGQTALTTELDAAFVSNLILNPLLASAVYLFGLYTECVSAASLHKPGFPFSIQTVVKVAVKDIIISRYENK